MICLKSWKFNVNSLTLNFKMNRKLLNACNGKTQSNGGLNLSEMKRILIKMYPNRKRFIESKSRKELESYCKRILFKNEPSIKSVNKEKSKYFVRGTPLNEKQKKYCRCLVHVAESKRTTNPYAICTKVTDRKGRFKCLPYYNLNNLTASEVRGLAKLHGKSVPQLKKYMNTIHRTKEWRKVTY